jgi:hypothetical protein
MSQNRAAVHPSAGAASPRPESSTPSAIDGSKGPAYGPFFYCRAWDTGLASVGYAPQIVSGWPGEHYDPVRRSGGAWCQQPSRRKRGLQITEAIRGKRILALGQWPPDRDGARDLLDLRRKGLDHYRTLELGVAQRAHDCRPREVIFTGRAAVTGTGMKLDDMPARPPQRSGNILFPRYLCERCRGEARRSADRCPRSFAFPVRRY